MCIIRKYFFCGNEFLSCVTSVFAIARHFWAACVAAFFGAGAFAVGAALALRATFVGRAVAVVAAVAFSFIVQLFFYQKFQKWLG